MSFLERYGYWKIASQRAFSHLSVPMAIINLTVSSGAYLTVSGYKHVGAILFLGGIALIIITLVIGHYDMKIGLYKIETSIANEHNPEIQRLIRDK